MNLNSAQNLGYTIPTAWGDVNLDVAANPETRTSIQNLIKGTGLGSFFFGDEKKDSDLLFGFKRTHVYAVAGGTALLLLALAMRKKKK